MRLTRQTSYAVRTLIYCAVNAPELSRIPDIARSYGISELFLFKLIKPLVENRLIETVRGRKGGIRLGRPADQITLLDVVKLTEENFALADCFESSGDVLCPLADNCDLSAALREALGAFFDVLESHTVADLAGRRRVLRARLGLGIEELTAPAAH